MSPIQFVNLSAATLNQRRTALLSQLHEGSRQRRSHVKSRDGCATCKRRRIKCDESIPVCGNCQKRHEKCIRRPTAASRRRKAENQHQESTGGDVTVMPQALSTQDSPLQMQLFHHFIACTADTLIFGAQVWQETVLPMSSKNDGLLNAILMLSASHLAYLTRASKEAHERYRHASLVYLSRTLQQYRVTLSHPIAAVDRDAVMAISLLLYHYVWANVEHGQSHPDHFDPSKDLLYTLSPGLQDIFAAGIISPTSGSVFRPHALDRPRIRLTQIAETRQVGSVGTMESTLLQCYTALSPTAYNESDSLSAYLDSAARLAPILALVDSHYNSNSETNSRDFVSLSSPVRKDILRYLFGFPVHFHPKLNALIASRDPRALLLLLYFYHAVRYFLSDDSAWWSHRRADLLEHQLARVLHVWPNVEQLVNIHCQPLSNALPGWS